MLNLDTLNIKVKKAQYAVRGPIVELAQELEMQGREIYYFNIGNPQQLGQAPLTYAREVLSLVNNPALLARPSVLAEFASDNVQRANEIMKHNPIGLGAYSQSAGMPFIRQAVADFIHERDNIPTNWRNVFLTDGASKGVDLVLNSLIRDEKDGVMIPIPQYPLYSADIALFGGTPVPYYLDEDNEWRLSEENLEETYAKAGKDGVNVRCLVVINPSNPTGALLSKENIKMVVEFAAKHDLAIIADEVYQENIYNPEDSFHSFAKVGHEQGSKSPIFSLHSTSKGFIGECGYRGGYIEMRNVDPAVQLEMLKLRSIGLCANTPGQIMTYLMVRPPKEGEESHELYTQERASILGALARKARSISTGLDKLDGVHCPTPRGAMYLFPRLELPEKDYGGKPADFVFCKTLVEEEGIVTVPGSGFGQLPGTWHLRMTFLPPEDKVPEILERFERCYYKFVGR